MNQPISRPGGAPIDAEAFAAALSEHLLQGGTLGDLHGFAEHAVNGALRLVRLEALRYDKYMKLASAKKRKTNRYCSICHKFNHMTVDCYRNPMNARMQVDLQADGTPVDGEAGEV